MDQNIGSEAPVDPAAVAFEALRREVSLLNVVLAGLAAERASAPDYSETLGEIAQGVRLAVGRIGKLATSPALAVTPAEIARQITAAGDEARRQDRATLHQAQEMLQRAAGDLRRWVDTARLARLQNRRLIQMTLVGMLAGWTTRQLAAWRCCSGRTRSMGLARENGCTHASPGSLARW